MAHTTAELRELFDLIDEDRSGSLDRGEIQNLAGRLGKHLTATQLDEAMAEMDTDGWIRRVRRLVDEHGQSAERGVC